eukprot:8348666-Karenia_brevis.AAC.1
MMKARYNSIKLEAMHFAILPKGVSKDMAPRQTTGSGERFALGHTTDLGFGEICDEDLLHMTLPLAPDEWADLLH